jgi:hypothetical protein
MRAVPTASLVLCALLSGCGGSDPPGATADAGPADVAPPDAGPMCPTEGSAQPDPRGDSAGAVDPATGYLWVFGGDTGPTANCRTTPVHRDDTWRYDPVCDRWTRVEAAGPSPRARMAYALDGRRRRLFVFGGRFRAGTTGNYTHLRDLWALDLATGAWRAVEAPDGPSARSNAAMAWDAAGDRLVLFGGNNNPSGLSFTPLRDTWVFDLAAETWQRVDAQGPSGRLFHAAVVADGALWVYGGGGANAFVGPFMGDLWRLDLASRVWSEVSVTGDTEGLARRINPALAPALGGGLTLVAGHDDGALGNRNDVVALTADGVARVLRPGDRLVQAGNGFCDFPANFTAPDMDGPERRSAFVFAHDPMRNRALVYGGKTDCGLAGDVWAIDLGTGAWSPQRATSDGLSCVRAGRTGCSALCQ